MTKLRSFFKTVIQNIGFGVNVSFHASRLYFVLKCIIHLSTTVVPLTTMWLWKGILNQIQYQQAFSEILLLLLLYILLSLLVQIMSRFDQYVTNRYSDELTFYIEYVMMEKISHMDLAFFDSASMGDKVRRTRANFDAISDVTWLVFDIFSDLINILLTFVIISRYNCWIGAVTILLMIPYLLFNKRYTRRKLDMEKEQLRDSRRRDYYAESFYSNPIQFEIKLHGLGHYFLDRYREIWSRLYHINKRFDIRYTLLNTLIQLLNVASEALILVISVLDVIGRRAGIGDLQYNVNIVGRLRGQTSKLITDVNTFLIHNSRLQELQEFLDIRPMIETSGNLAPSPHPRIEFCHVTFKYPNADAATLQDCSFAIEPYQKVGLVGLNGAGKSTLIKLLFRFYDPQDGRIELDGVDLRDYDVHQVRRLFGVLFQDYVTYSLPLREIIALSDFPQRRNDVRLQRACGISGFAGVIQNWKEGFDTILGRFYTDNGADLSGGQWQLLGLTRTYFREADYYILDEPSASLDPIAEDRIFTQLAELSDNKTSIMISHRLSNMTLVDTILVLQNGRIAEQGSHHELLRQNGVYAKLFRLQASRYSPEAVRSPESAQPD